MVLAEVLSEYKCNFLMDLVSENKSNSYLQILIRPILNHPILILPILTHPILICSYQIYFRHSYSMDFSSGSKCNYFSQILILRTR